MLPVKSIGRLERFPSATVSLVAVNTLFLVLILTPAIVFLLDHVLAFGIFLHGSFLHYFFNMLFLWVFGSTLEDKIGWKKFLAFYLLCGVGATLLHEILDGDPAIGASGAISGVLAIYLYRCRHYKLRTIVWCGWYYTISIPAPYFILAWLFGDLLLVFSGVQDRIAHWAHIGGFVSGMIIGKISGYAEESQKEHLLEQAIRLADSQSGLGDARTLFEKVLSLDPENSDIHLRLARILVRDSDAQEESTRHYLKACGILDRDSRLEAAEVFLELVLQHRFIGKPETHLAYSRLLAESGHEEDACRLLAPLLGSLPGGGISRLVLLETVRFAHRAGFDGQRDEALDLLRRSHPTSREAKEAEALLSSPRAVRGPRITLSEEMKTRTDFRAHLERVTAEPVYWVSWTIIMNLALLFGVTPFLFLAFSLMAFVFAFGETYLMNMIGSFAGGLFMAESNKSEREGMKDFNISFYFDKAVDAERRGRLDEAATYYRAVLKENGNHIQARFNLARMLEKQGSIGGALKEYHALLVQLPPGHLFTHEAEEAIVRLRSKNRGTLPG